MGWGVGVTELLSKISKFRRIAFLHMVSKNICMKFQHSPIKIVDGVRKSTKGVGGGGIWPRGQKFKIPPHYVFAYGYKEHPYAFSTPSYQNCRRSSQKYEKVPPNDQFIAPKNWTKFFSTSKAMPGSYFFQYAYTISISWWLNPGKIPKKLWRTDGRLINCMH